MPSRFQFRRANASAWTSANPTLAAGELGFELDTKKFKIGDGTTAWTSLDYASSGGGGISGATAPITYDSEAKTVALSYGSGLTTSAGTLTIGTISAASVSGTAVVQSEVDTSNTVNKIVKRDDGGTIAVSAVNASGVISGSTLAGSLLSSATPGTLAVTASSGTSRVPSREDHAHPTVVIYSGSAPSNTKAVWVDSTGTSSSSGPLTQIYSGNGSANATVTSVATYANPATGTAASVTVPVVNGTKLLVTLSYAATTDTADRVMVMGFNAASTGSAGITLSASNSMTVSNGAKSVTANTPPLAQSASYLLTATGTGTVKLDAQYYVSAASTWTLLSHSIIVLTI